MATKSNRSSGTQHNQRGVTQGNTLVGPKSGLPIDEIVDTGGIRRLAVDANINATIGSVNVDLDYTDDSVSIGDPNTSTTLKINANGSIDANVEVDAADGDNIAISAHANQIFAEAADTVTTAVFEEIFSYTSADNNTKITEVFCTVGTPSLVQLKINGAVKRQFWTSPLERNALFEFTEHRSLLNTQILSIEVKIDRLILSSYDTFVSMEGYIS